MDFPGDGVGVGEDMVTPIGPVAEPFGGPPWIILGKVAKDVGIAEGEGEGEGSGGLAEERPGTAGRRRGKGVLILCGDEGGFFGEGGNGLIDDPLTQIGVGEIGMVVIAMRVRIKRRARVAVGIFGKPFGMGLEEFGSGYAVETVIVAEALAEPLPLIPIGGIGGEAARGHAT